MKRIAFLATVFTTVLVLVLPFVGGGGPGLTAPAVADSGSATPLLASVTAPVVVAPVEVARVAIATTTRIDEDAIIAAAAAHADALTKDTEHLAQKAVPKPPPPSAGVAADGSYSAADRRAALEAAGYSCPGNVGGGTGGAPSRYSAGGVAGTTSDDLASFAYTYNSIRVANCLDPIPLSNFYWDSCMEDRLFWMAEDPSPDPASAWGHMGSQRSDGVPSVGCDGNLAGGMGNTGATVASKWWESSAHRASLYRPGSSSAGACIAFAMTHGDNLGQEPYGFTRAAARWTWC